MPNISLIKLIAKLIGANRISEAQSIVPPINATTPSFILTVSNENRPVIISTKPPTDFSNAAVTSVANVLTDYQ